METSEISGYVFQAAAALLSAILSIGISFAIERLGGVLGGLISSSPSIVVIDALGILVPSLFRTNFVITDELLLVYQSIYLTVPVAVAMNAVYLCLWSIFPLLAARYLPNLSKGRQIAILTASSLILWFFAAVGVVFSFKQIPGFNGLKLNLKNSLQNNTAFSDAKTPFTSISITLLMIATASFLFSLFIALYFGWNPPAAPKGNRRINKWVVILRGVLVFFVRVLAFGLTKLESKPDTVIALILMAPTILTIAMVTLTMTSGSEVATGAIGPIMLGMTSGSVFSIASSLLLPSMNFGWVMFTSVLLGIAIINVPGIYYLRKRNKCSKRL